MTGEERPVQVQLSYDEAYEILNRCLLAQGEDTKLFRDALRKLAWAIEKTHAEDVNAA